MDYRTAGLEVIREIQKKILYLTLAIVAGLMIGWYVAYFIIVTLKSQMLPPGVNLIALTPLEFVIVQLKISIILIVLAGLPYLAYLLIKRLKIKKSGPVLLAWGVCLIVFFSSGVLFGYYLLLPIIITFLTTNIMDAGMEPLYSVNDFVFFSISMMVILGLVFEFPVVTVWLTRAGIISSQTLSEKRKHAYVAIFIIAAVVTPDPSMVSQSILAVPFIFFYELSILVSRLFGFRGRT
ncbi:MAG: twin-arginine translocase subunit TatC [Candidatus Hydrothermarchaeaceae archaeon]